MLNNNKKSLLLSATVALTAMLASGAQAAETLDAVKAEGMLKCGVSTGLPGFSAPDENGNWQGLDVDVCRGVAAAIFNDPSKVQFVPLNAKERFTALQSGEIDVLSRNTTWTSSRDTALGLNFTGVTYYDGIGFMVDKSLGLDSALQLGGASICVQSGTTTELNVADYFRANDMAFEPVVFDTSDQTARGFEAGRCDVLTSDTSQLYSLRIKLSDPASAEVLPEVISKEPLGPVVRQGDEQWFDIVKWTLFAMFNAEELGVTSENVDEMKANPPNPKVARLLGVNSDFGESMGLSSDWAYNIIKQVGNYGEIFARNVGEDSALDIERGLNALWVDGGLHYGMPVR